MGFLNAATAPATTITVPTMTVGDTFAFLVFSNALNGSVTVTDSAGNTYTVVVGGGQQIASMVGVWVFRMVVTTGGSSVVVTVHNNTSGAPNIMYVRFSGLGALDVSGNGNEGTNATSHSCGGMTTNGGTETIICLNGQGTIGGIDSYTPASGFTIPAGASQSDPSVAHTGFIQYQTGVLQGTFNNVFGTSQSSRCAGVILGFKEAGWSTGTPIVVVQSVVGSSPSLSVVDATITGVASGNTLIALASLWSSSSGGSVGPAVCNDTSISTALSTAVAQAGTAAAGAITNLMSAIYFLPSASVTAGTHVIEVDTSSLGCNITKANLVVVEVSGLASSPFDVGTFANGTTGQSLTAGPVGPTAQANEIVFAVVSQRSTPGVSNAAFACSGFVDLFNDSVTTDGLGSDARYEFLNSVTSPSAAFAWSDAGTLASQGCIATFKGSVGGGGGGSSARQLLMMLGVG